MFRTDIRAMAEASQEMQLQIRKMNQAIYETENIINGLGCMSGLENVITVLRREIDRMESERRKLQNMVTALNQIQSCYQNCENSILDYAEGMQTRRMAANFSWYSIPVSTGIMPMLSSIIY